MKQIVVFILFVGSILYAQETDSLQTQETTTNQYKPLSVYTLGDIEVTGGTPYTKQQILRFTGMQIGEEIEVPGAKINNGIKKLWRTGLFSDVSFYAQRVEGQRIYLRVNLVGLPRIVKTTVNGTKKSKKEDIIKDNNLKPGTKITKNLLNQTSINIKNGYVEKGFPDATVNFKQKVDSVDKYAANLTVNVNRGDRVKVNKILIDGNENISDSKIRRKGFKNTKKRSINFFRSSKLIPGKYQEDLKNVVDLYKSYGYRDAKVVSDTVFRDSDNNYIVKIKVNEGNQYYLGDVTFVGNSVYPTELLERVFSYKKGDPYDAVGINSKITGSEKDDDISTLYLDKGYLFSQVMPIEKSVKNDTIDLEIRIQEGSQATWDKVTFSGNNQTHDHVIARELRTRPGELFSKSAIKRTFYQLGSLGYFDPQQIGQDIQPNPDNNTVDIEWKLAPKSSSQIELQGGYGGGRFIGTLGLTFQNFSIGNLFKGKAWKPVPLGDGQALSLRAQAGSNYSNFSLSFTEPWIGGSKPTALSTSIYNSNYTGLYSNSDSRLNIIGASVGLNKLLSWPDDYFRLSQSLGYQRYKFRNYPLQVSTIGFENGNSNDLAYTIGLSRLSGGPDPIFPTEGSDFNVSLKLTPPWSLFNKKDYKKLRDEENYEEIYKWLEYYKIKFNANWYKELIGKLVLRAGADFGFLGAYNNDVGISPFERFYVGGTGLQANRFDGREIIPLRGYDDSSNFGGSSTDITPLGGGTIYNKFLLELRYPITMGQQAKIYGLGFLAAANTWSNHDDFKPFELKRSAGFGIRIFMPAFGLLGFDFGYGFDNYIIGQDNKGGWQTHFIFGQQL